ncbi:hypothetical protein GGX14DRAFT_479829 [Mycena pura]|uniref:BTB domain-containing protein n=1 Tax=Mycena pura TaxID=153505 RepID=A0AAD6Y1U4_9AGAR|nr:hypothetical protein GGX14DRAFT_479829 [Mycena pura]
MPEAPTAFEDAPPPFSGCNDADDTFRTPSDFIIRSHDGVEFHLHKDILKMVSHCFDGMFSVPGGDGNPCELERDGKPVVVLPEPASVLSRLLSLAYPALSPGRYTLKEADLDGVVALHAAANKYQFIHVQCLLERMLENSSLLESHPHRVFAIARLRDLPDLARKAALSTLEYNVCRTWTREIPDLPKIQAAVTPLKDSVRRTLAWTEFPEMRELTWDHVHKLLAFHHTCKPPLEQTKVILKQEISGNKKMMAGTRDANGNLVTSHFQYFCWWGWKDHASECGPKGDIPAPWFLNLTNRLADELFLIPSSTAKTEALPFTPTERKMIDECHECSNNARAERDLRIWIRKLAYSIESSNKEYARVFF